MILYFTHLLDDINKAVILNVLIQSEISTSQRGGGGLGDYSSRSVVYTLTFMSLKIPPKIEPQEFEIF